MGQASGVTAFNVLASPMLFTKRLLTREMLQVRLSNVAPIVADCDCQSCFTMPTAATVDVRMLILEDIGSAT